MESYHPMRPMEEESVAKRTFYISEAVEIVEGVVLLKHLDVDSVRLDIIWDRRREGQKRLNLKSFLQRWMLGQDSSSS